MALPRTKALVVSRDLGSFGFEHISPHGGCRPRLFLSMLGNSWATPRATNFLRIEQSGRGQPTNLDRRLPGMNRGDGSTNSHEYPKVIYQPFCPRNMPRAEVHFSGRLRRFKEGSQQDLLTDPLALTRRMLKSDFAEKPFSDEKTWGGAACSAWRRPRRLWEPQATPLEGRSGQSRVFHTHTIQEDQPESAKRGEYDPEKLAFPVTLVPYPRL